MPHPTTTRPDPRTYLTPAGAARFRAELDQLWKVERPKVVEVVSWAAGNGDRSENGDYIYGKKRLREIDRRVRFLTKRLESAVVVDPTQPARRDRVFFGAIVTILDDDDRERTVQIVGADEAELAEGTISVLSPMARALLKAGIGDEVELRTPGGIQYLEVREIRYPES
ncbi:MAG: transcription elongation factor GreB [Azospirillaceae bacterium]